MGQTTIMEWRVCPRFPDYEVSECGDVRRVTRAYNRPVGFRLRGFMSAAGYPAYAITPEGSDRNETVFAYRLVAEAFLGPPPSPKHEVAHRNGSRLSAHYRHLRWSTRKANHADMQAHGTAVKGERNGRSKLTNEQAAAARDEYRKLKRLGGGNKYGRLKALQEKYGLSQTSLALLGTGKTWRHLPPGEEL